MKKRNLKGLNLNKKSISNLSKLLGGKIATSDPIQAQTCEGPCPGGTGSCHVDDTLIECTIHPDSLTVNFQVCGCTKY